MGELCIESGDRFELLGRVEEMIGETPRIFRFGKREIAIFHSGGRFFAVKNLCPHHGVELSKGSVENNRVRCPGHGFLFDLGTGQCDRDPTLCASTFEVKVQSGELFIRL